MFHYIKPNLPIRHCVRGHIPTLFQAFYLSDRIGHSSFVFLYIINIE